MSGILYSGYHSSLWTLSPSRLKTPFRHRSTLSIDSLGATAYAANVLEKTTPVRAVPVTKKRPSLRTAVSAMSLSTIMDSPARQRHPFLLFDQEANENIFQSAQRQTPLAERTASESTQRRRRRTASASAPQDPVNTSFFQGYHVTPTHSAVRRSSAGASF
jgi:hypothetical protein